MSDDIPYGYCHCGCGEKTRIPKRNSTIHNQIKGISLKFINGHNSKGKNNPRWIGGRVQTEHGYVKIWIPEHPKAQKGYVFEHILIAEEVFGKYLPEKAKIHHVNQIKNDNRKENLVICQNLSYHMLLHARIKARDECGNPNWRKCGVCEKYDDPENLVKNTQRRSYHRECINIERKMYRQRSINGKN